jgi:Domain of unknown function (DUF397)
MWRTSSHSLTNGHCLECGEWTDWETSSFSFSNGNCVAWRKSTHSASGDCLEVCRGVQVRDSQLKNAEGENVSPVLTFPSRAWREFTASLR